MAVAAKTHFTLVIDAGHGGHDAGAIGKITKEKAINLNVALAFGRLVERNCPDIKVIYTRKSDVFVPLHTRADIANRNKADLFISIHTNSLPKGKIARGMETYTLGMHRAADNLDVAKRENSVILIEKDYKQRYQGFDPNSSESYIMFEFMQDHNMAQSVELAKYVQKRTCNSAARLDKGVKQAGFLVLRETSMPSCLIELGFISTPDEEQFLHSDVGVGRLALGIYQAFLDYKQKHVSGGGAVVYQPQLIPTPRPAQQVAQQQAQPAQTSGSRKRSKMAQELADAREGRDVPSITVNISPSADSIVAVIPSAKTAVNPDQPVQAATVVPASPAVSLAQPVSDTSPIFKVQVMASGIKIKINDPQLKGLKNVDFYQESGLYKYTVGASANYDEINRLRKTVSDRFPQAFIIAFKNGEKINVQQAVQEFKNGK